MTLRTRIICAVGLALALCLGLGAALAGDHVRGSVRAELEAALENGGRLVSGALVLAAPGESSLAGITKGFDGARHLQVTLLDASGRVITRSQPRRPDHPAPGWFAAMFSPRLAPVVIRSGRGRFVVSAAPQNELAEAWGDLRDGLIVLGVFCAGALLAVHAATSRALQPLSSLARACSSLTAGLRNIRVVERGPAELALLARSFNTMAEGLELAARRAEALQEQVERLQEEERAELARDLHDEIGPHLFAMGVDAAVIGAEAERLSADVIVSRVATIRTALDHTRETVTQILGRLRPPILSGMTLEEAVGTLFDFWRRRRPDVEFVASVAALDARLGTAQRLAIYRLVQEGLSNAMRHASASRVQVTVQGRAGEDVWVEVLNDGAREARPARAGHGLTGMDERIRASGGVLSVDHQPSEGAWRIRAVWAAARGAA